MNNQEIHSGSWLKKISKNGKWYLLTSIFTKGAAILLLPVYTSYLTKGEIGAFMTLNNIGVFMAVFLSLAIETSFLRLYHLNNDKTFHVRLFSTTFWFVFIFGLIFTSLFVLSSYFWLEKYYYISFLPYAILSFLPILALQLSNLGFLFLSQGLESKKISVIQILAAIIGISIGMVLLIPFKLGLTARISAEAIKSVVMLIFTVAYFRKRGFLKFEFDFDILKKCLRFSTPMIPYTLAPVILSFSGSLFIANKSGLAKAGEYNMAMQIAILIYLVQDSITQVLTPIITSGLKNDKENALRKLSEFTVLLFAILVFSNLFLSTYCDQFIKLLANRDFLGVSSFITVLGFIHVLGAQNRLYTTILIFHSKNWQATLFLISSAIITLILNIFLIPRCDETIVPYINLTGILINLTLVYSYAYRLENIQTNFILLFKILGLFIIFLLLVNYSKSWFDAQFAHLIFKSFLVVIYGYLIIRICNYQSQLLLFFKERFKFL